MAHNEPIRQSPSNSDIPDKLYFRIGDVAKLCEVPAYVLRFWESEFPQLKPNKGGTGQRLYRRKDVEMALRIKRLLYDEGYTIPGARQVFKQDHRETPGPQLALAIEAAPPSPRKDLRRLQMLRKELQDVQALLSRPAGEGKISTLHTIRARTSNGLALTSRPAVPEMDDLFDQRPTLLRHSESEVED